MLYTIQTKQFIKSDIDDGVEMKGIVYYKLPFGFFGKIAHALFVKKQLKTIFDFRFKKIEELFNNN